MREIQTTIEVVPSTETKTDSNGFKVPEILVNLEKENRNKNGKEIILVIATWLIDAIMRTIEAEPKDLRVIGA